VLSLTDVIHFLAHEFAGLGARRLALTFVLAGSLDSLLLWHVNLQ
jgi:hypothetical protein